MSQQPPPWGPQQFPQHGPGSETPSGVPAPPDNQPSWQPSGSQPSAPQYPQQQYPGQYPAPQQYPAQSYGQASPQPVPQQSAPRPPAPSPQAVPGGPTAAPAPSGVGSPATWFTRFPRLLLLAGAVLSVFMMMTSWASLTYTLGSSSSSSIKSGIHGLAWLAYGSSSSAPVSSGAWNFRVIVTVLALVALMVLGSIALALDRLLPKWWDLVSLICAGVLGVLMIWGVIQAAQFTGSAGSGVEGSIGAGVWLFLITCLATIGGALWQFIDARRAAAPGPAASPQWGQAPGWQQPPQQPGYPQGQPPQPQAQQPPQQFGVQQGWQNNQWPGQ